VARGNQVVEAVVAAIAPRHEVVDLALASDVGVAVEAPPALKVEQSFGDPLKRHPVAAE
jgi:hypothetical protein